jgi:glutamate N-acetyltransferase/amino-acid N-acetyltransferase
MKIYKKAVLPQGFLANGIGAGIKKSGKKDLALFYSVKPAKAAVLATANTVKGAALKVNQRYLANSKDFQAIVVNSGNANCFTGREGFKDAEQMTQYAATALNINRKKVLVASTGIIGKKLPVSKIEKAMPQLAKGLSAQGINAAKLAILTTDTFSKEIAVKFNIGKRWVTICGVAKGSGMIAPNMATMLGFIFTDANITQRALNQALLSAVGQSFNCISVDNCMSTNDTVIILANGVSGNTLIEGKKNLQLFSKALNLVCLELAKKIVEDAEGATKFIRITVGKAASLNQARIVAMQVANSDLFKTAIYGQSPNFFGRVVAAVGSSGIKVQEERLKIKASSLKKKHIDIDIQLNAGNASAVAYTCDLTHEYIKINTEYN